MKIAVTGTSGRIGRAIHFALCREHEVVGIDRSVSSVTTHLGEIDDYKLLTKAFKGPLPWFIQRYYTHHMWESTKIVSFIE